MKYFISILIVLFALGDLWSSDFDGTWYVDTISKKGHLEDLKCVKITLMGDCVRVSELVTTIGIDDGLSVIDNTWSDYIYVSEKSDEGNEGALWLSSLSEEGGVQVIKAIGGKLHWMNYRETDLVVVFRCYHFF